jgi:hypothetical protein
VAKDSYAWQLADALAIAKEQAGEHVDAVLGEEFQKPKEAHANELERLASPTSSDPLQDGYKAFVADYIDNPDKAQTEAPAFYEAFGDHLAEEADPRILQHLDEISVALDQPGVRRLLTAVAADPHFTGAFGLGRHELYKRLGDAHDA